MSLAIRLESTQNSTRLMGLLEEASAVKRAVWPTVASAVGAVRATVGPAGAIAGMTTVHVALAPGDSTLPASSVERTSASCDPMPSPDT